MPADTWGLQLGRLQSRREIRWQRHVAVGLTIRSSRARFAASCKCYTFSLAQGRKAARLNSGVIRHIMQLLKFLVLLSTSFVAACATGGHPAGENNLRLEADISTAGPDGQLWEIQIKEYKDGSGAKLRFKTSLGMGRGNIQGDVTLNEARLSTIKNALASSDFSHLPISITE